MLKLQVVGTLRWEVLHHVGVGLKLQVVRTLRREVLHHGGGVESVDGEDT